MHCGQIDHVNLLTIGLSLFGCYIACQQLQIQKSLKALQEQRLIFDLFEKRFAVYNLIDASVNEVIQHQNIKSENVRKVFTAARDSHFLFDDKMVQYLDELSEKFNQVRVKTEAVEILKAENVDSAVISNTRNEVEELRKWFLKQLSVNLSKGEKAPPLVEKFKPYLRFGTFSKN